MIKLGQLASRGTGRITRELRSALANGTSTSGRLQVAGWRRGFYAETLPLYDIERYGFEAYISDYQRATQFYHLNRSPHLLDDKFVTYLYLQHIGIRTPVVYGIGHGDRLLLFPDSSDRSRLDELIRRVGKLVLKPRFGTGGRQVTFVEHADGGVKLNGQPGGRIADALRGRYFLSEYIEQHAYAKGIYARASNTIRLLTLKPKSGADPFLAAAVHRFGTEKTAPVDSWAQGGLSAAVDLSTGTLGPGVARPDPGSVSGLVWQDWHPDSGAPLAGVVVPYWDEIKREILRLAASLIDFSYIGWDVLVTNDGFAVLEGNNRSNVNLFQVHRPLLLDPRVRDFVRRRD